MTREKEVRAGGKPCLLVLASTYPRWEGDPEPGFVHELSKRLTRKFRVIVLGPHAPGAKTREVLDGVEVVRYRYAPTPLETLVNGGGIMANIRLRPWKLLLVPAFMACQLAAAWRICRREQVDLIHAHWIIPQGLVAAVLQSLPGRNVPFVVTAHGSDVHALKGRTMSAMRKLIIDRSAQATVVSRQLRMTLDPSGENAPKVSVMPMGVDLNHRFSPDASIARSPGQLLFVGRLVAGKGIEHLLQAMPFVLKSIPEARLTIAGTGPLREALETLCIQTGLRDKVEFLGALPQAELPNLYRRASLLVAPFAQNEGLGLVLVEAVGCGCPVLTSGAPAFADILGEALADHSVDPEDTQLLAQGIIEKLTHRSATYPQALHSRVLTQFDWEHVAARYERTLQQAIKGST